MLSRRALGALASAALSLVQGATPPPETPAPTPTPVVICPPGQQVCFLDVGTPGQPGPETGSTPPASGGSRTCVLDLTGETVPCFDPDWGWFNSRDDCYYRSRDPQPPASDPIWNGHFPDGVIYAVTCTGPLGAPGTSGGWVWLATPPEGFGAAETTPGELAARAVEQMQLTGAQIGHTPENGRLGLVGVPVWLWTTVTPTTWGPNTATAAVPGLSVTATAQAIQIDWAMGDGSTVTCTNPGTPYYTGGIESPTCDHVYERSSAGQPDDAFTITATTTWEVSWSGGGTSGVLTVTRTSESTVRIGELQVLVTA